MGWTLRTCPGHPLTTVQAQVATPLWLIDLFAGITGSEEREPEESDPPGQRHFTVTSIWPRRPPRHPTGWLARRKVGSNLCTG